MTLIELVQTIKRQQEELNHYVQIIPVTTVSVVQALIKNLTTLNTEYERMIDEYRTRIQDDQITIDNQRINLDQLGTRNVELEKQLQAKTKSTDELVTGFNEESETLRKAFVNKERELAHLQAQYDQLRKQKLRADRDVKELAKLL